MTSRVAGNITRYLLNKRPDLKVLGIDLSENMIALARQNNPGAAFRVMDCRNINSLYKVDAVVCAFCLPYLPIDEATELIREAIALLNHEGVLYLSTIEDNYSYSGPQTNSRGDVIDMYFYDEAYLSEVLQKVGCTITCKQRTQSTNAGKDVIDLILIAQKVNT